jgi:hypothetical protein
MVGILDIAKYWRCGKYAVREKKTYIFYTLDSVFQRFDTIQKRVEVRESARNSCRAKKIIWNNLHYFTGSYFTVFHRYVAMPSINIYLLLNPIKNMYAYVHG